MPIFKNTKGKLSSIKEKSIKLEKDIQKLTEDNLALIFGLKFISTEFSLQNFRIDTLAFDNDTNSFVIIEYKRGKSFSVVDQGFSYLSLLLNNKDSFILEYARKTNIDLAKIKIDWSQSKVVFISESFTTYQQNAINFKDLPIELWEVSNYENDTILYNKLKSSDGSESINTISKNKTITSVSKEVKKYSVDDHFKSDWDESREIFDELKERILLIDNNFQEVPTKTYIGYKLGNKVLFDINTRKSKLEIHLYRIEIGDLNDPQNELEYMEKSMQHWNKHVCKFSIKSVDDVDYAIFLIKQSYKKFK